MREYILKRIILVVPILFLVSVMVFSIVRLIPGDVVVMMFAETGNATPERLALFRRQLGLDRPALEQYAVWMGRAVQGDLGDSMWTGRPALEEILKRFPVSGELAVLAMVLACVLALPLGVLAAARQDSAIDYAVRLVSVGMLSIPSFWIGTMVVTFLAIWFQWIPPIGYVSLLDDPWRNVQQLMLPALAIGARASAAIMRMTRSQTLEILRQNYVRTAWAKGLRERVVVLKHALKNAMIPVITIMGNQFGYLLGGTVVMEIIFSLPGVGRLTLDSIIQRDYTQLQGIILFVATVSLLVNLLVDLTYAWFDPRIRYQ
jgi:peptide/nickel transport system permease protein